MPTVTELRRRVTVEGKTVGVKEATNDLQKLDTAYTGVTLESVKMEKATLSNERALRTLQSRLDPTFRATERLAAAEKTLTIAQSQGLITLARKNELMVLAAAQTDRAAASAARYAAASRGSGFGGILGGFGIAALTAIPVAVAHAISSVGDLADAADRAGVSAEKLQVFRFAIQQSGGEAEDADSALQKFTTSLGRAGTVGGGPAASSFKALGVNVKDASGHLRDSEDVLQEVINKLGRIENPAAVAGLAAGIFGKEAGPKMAQLIMQGDHALENYERTLRDTGGLMSNETVDAADKLDDKFKRLQQSASTLAKTIAVELGGAIGFLFDQVEQRAASDRAFWTGLTNITNPQLGAMGGGPAKALKEQTAAAQEWAAAVGQATESIQHDLAGTVIPLTDKMRDRWAGAFGDAATSTDKLTESLKNPIDLVPLVGAGVHDLPNAFDEARSSAEAFAQGLVVGLSAGVSLVGALAAPKKPEPAKDAKESPVVRADYLKAA